jgi:hypothetical protein
MSWPESRKAAKLLLLLQHSMRPFCFYSHSYSLLTALGDGHKQPLKGCPFRTNQTPTYFSA